MDFMKRLGGALHKSNVNISIRETQSRMVPPSYAILEANTAYIFSQPSLAIFLQVDLRSALLTSRLYDTTNSFLALRKYFVRESCEDLSDIVKTIDFCQDGQAVETWYRKISNVVIILLSSKVSWSYNNSIFSIYVENTGDTEVSLFVRKRRARSGRWKMSSVSGDHPVPISNHAHAIGQISREGGGGSTRDKVYFELASVHGRDGRFSAVVSWSTRGTWHRVVTLNESLCTPALPRVARACHVQVFDGTAPATCRRRRSGMSPSVIAREPLEVHNLRC